MNQKKIENLMKFPVTSHEELQIKWKYPVKVKLINNRSMLICTMISTENGKFVWHCAIRIGNEKKGTVKKRNVWMPSEILAVSMELEKELDGVGEGTGESFDSEFSRHLWKWLTKNELSEFFKHCPHLAKEMLGITTKSVVEEEIHVSDNMKKEFDPNWLDKKR